MANSTAKWLLKIFTFGAIIQNIFGQDISPDFIIVGGGISGCVLASRLSKKYSVLLVEAGEDSGDKLDIPATALSHLGKIPGISKVYTSVSQKNAALRNPTNGQVSFTIGTTLGGGSSVNTLIFNRGSPYDYDNWANVTSDPSWNYENLLKYFKRMEDYHGRFPSEKNHGKGGPLTISSPKYAPGLEAWLDAGKWLGLSSNVDPNGPQIPSFTPIEFTSKRGRRVSAYTAYVKPHLSSRPYLKILPQTVVKKVIFDDDNTRAIGVAYSLKNADETTINVYANKEVIISAGVMDSPAILMRSGIGPIDVLKDSNIPLVKELPVGYNLQDHVIFKLKFLLDKNASNEVFIAERDLTPETWKVFEETGDGPYSSFGISAQAYLVSSVREQEPHPNPEWPDIQLFQIHSGEKHSFVPELEREDEESDLSVYVVSSLQRPKSRGRVSLNSSNIYEAPVIDFNFLSDPEDHDMLVLMEAVKTAVKIYEEAPSFQKMGGRLPKIPYGPCGNFEFRSDDYWRCFIRDMAGSGLHAAGTCRMGRGKDDKNAVVDSQLKVIGIGGLRVVDCSVMPDITNTNTQAAAYVIGEKAADMILTEWDTKRDEL